MKRTINFEIKGENYVFYETNNSDNVLNINKHNIILNGNDLYTMFFEKFNEKDTFSFVDKTSLSEKETDKLCIPIYNEVRKIVENIEKVIKE